MVAVAALHSDANLIAHGVLLFVAVRGSLEVMSSDAPVHLPYH